MRACKTCFVSFLIIVCASVPAFAQSGSTAYDFLNIPTSSYVMGMGGTNVSSLQSDINLADQNPSLLGPENDKELKVGYMLYYGSSNFAGARFAMAAGEHGAWAAGVRYLNHGAFSGYDDEGISTGDFTVQDIVFEGTYSHDITYSLRGGINVKFVYSGYEQYTALALAADLGLSYYDEFHDFSLGVVLKNMGGQIKRFEDSYNRLPFDVELGITKGLGRLFSFSITANNLVRWKIPYYRHSDDQEIELKDPGFFQNFFRHLIFGVEYQPTESFYAVLAYNYKTRSDMASFQRNFLSGFSIGAGFRVKAYSVDLSYALPHKGASTLLINLGLDISDFL